MVPFAWQSNKATLVYFAQNSVSEIPFGTSVQRPNFQLQYSHSVHFQNTSPALTFPMSSRLKTLPTYSTPLPGCLKLSGSKIEPVRASLKPAPFLQRSVPLGGWLLQPEPQVPSFTIFFSSRPTSHPSTRSRPWEWSCERCSNTFCQPSHLLPPPLPSP